MNDLALRELDRTECLGLLVSANLGRLAFTRRALPVIVPARYLLNGDHILIHVSTGLDQIGWIDGEIVALQVNAFDDTQTYGWSVSVTGAAHGIPDPIHGEQQPTAPWIPHGGGDLITLPTELIRGERLGPTESSSRRQHPSSRES